MKKSVLFLSLLIISISFITAFGEEALTPKIAFRDKVFVADEVLEGAIIEHTYTVYNRGNGVLRINRVSPGWGCSVAEFDRAIPPGREGRIKITFDTNGKRGKVVKSIGVFSNDPEKRNEHLRFEASIKPLFRFSPSDIVYLTGKKGEMKRAEVLITTELSKPLKIKPEGFTLETKVSYSLESVETERQYRVVFKNNPGNPGNFNGELRLSTNYPEKPLIKIRVHTRFDR